MCITEMTKQRKMNVLKNATLLYYEWIDMYKKEYEDVFKNKDEKWKKKYGYKNLKDFSYQVDKGKKDDTEKKKAEKEKDDEDETKNEKEDKDKTDQALPSWIKSKNEFNKLKNYIFSINDSILKTSTKKYEYDFSDSKN